MSIYWFKEKDLEKLAKEFIDREAELRQQNNLTYTSQRLLSELYDYVYPDDFERQGQGGVDSVFGVASQIAAPAQNIIGTIIDAAVPLVARQRLLPKVVPIGGGWEGHRATRLMNTVIRRYYPKSMVYDACTEMACDGLLSGTGVVLVRKCDDNIIKCERVEPWRVAINSSSHSNTNKVHECFIRSRVSTLAMAEEYEDVEFDDEDSQLVTEGWTLHGGGIHYAKTLADGTLLEHEFYKGDTQIPVFFYRPQRPRNGFWGIGLGRKIQGKQLRSEKIDEFINHLMDRHTRPTLVVPDGGGVSRGVKVGDVDMDIIMTPDGRSPVIYTPQVDFAPLYAAMERLGTKSKEEVGMSQFSMTSQVPTGVESAPAIREVAFKNQDRHFLYANAYEEVLLAIGEYLVEEARRTIGKKGIWVSDLGGQMEEFPDISSDEVKLTVTMSSTALSTLSQSFRVQTVLEWAQQGLLNSAAEARRLIGQPDLEESDRYSSAAHEDEALDIIDRLSAGDRIVPDVYMDLGVIVPKIRAAMAVARTLRMDEKDAATYNAFGAFMDQCEAMKMEAQKAVPAPMGGDEGMPVSNISRAAAQGLNAPGSGGGKSSEGI